MLPLTGRGQHSHHVMMSGKAEPNAFSDHEGAISLCRLDALCGLGPSVSQLDFRFSDDEGAISLCRLDAFADLPRPPFQAICRLDAFADLPRPPFQAIYIV